ncbi:MAG: nucA 2 [Mucilaginibacter sp.]|nr:nucA 2 [Mucilaginibacter sp.]
MKRNSIQLHITIWVLMIIAIASFNRCYGQQQVFNKPGYVSYFNAAFLIPDSVIWTITKDHLTGTKIKRNNQFHSEPGMQNLKRDYANSQYDQGHNSPYDDNYYSNDAEYQCFSYVNMFPQLHKLNAQTWERLEDYCRKMALQYGSCKVKTSWFGIDKKIGVDSVVVPRYCTKEIWYGGKHEFYAMPNRDSCILHPFTYYKVVPGSLLVNN